MNHFFINVGFGNIVAVSRILSIADPDSAPARRDMAAFRSNGCLRDYTGLDPLMQKSFTEIIKQEKKKGKTIFMSSHMFDEMETTCDRVAFLKNGKIIRVVDMKTILGNENVKEYKIEFNNESDYKIFLTRSFDITRKQDEYSQVTIHIPDEDVNKLFGVLSAMDVRFISHKPYTLEACFREIYNNTEVA